MNWHLVTRTLALLAVGISVAAYPRGDAAAQMAGTWVKAIPADMPADLLPYGIQFSASYMEDELLVQYLYRLLERLPAGRA